MENIREIADTLGYICLIGCGVTTVITCIATDYTLKDIEKEKKELSSEGQLEDTLREYSKKE